MGVPFLSQSVGMTSADLQQDGTVGNGVAAAITPPLAVGRTITANTVAALTDNNTLLVANSSNPITITIPSDTSVLWTSAVGIAAIQVVQMGLGQVSFTGATGVTVTTSDTALLSAQYGSLSIRRIAANTWNVVRVAAVRQTTWDNVAVKPKVGFAGDSINVALGALLSQQSPLFWALARDFPADLYINANSYANGGYSFAQGGQGLASILANQLPQVQARTPDILFLNGGVNDSFVNAAQVVTLVATQVAMITGSLNAGVKLVVVEPIHPRNNGGGNVAPAMALISEFNRAIARFCANTSGTYFLDTIPSIIAPTSTTFAPIGALAAPFGTAGSVTEDGLHPSTTGARAATPYFSEFLSKVARRRVLRAVNASDTYDAVNNRRGNIVGGAIGTAQATGGILNGVVNAGVPLGWTIVSSGGATVVPSIVQSIATAVNPAGFNMCRLTLSGTTTTVAGVIALVTISGLSAEMAAGIGFDFEAIARCINLTNCNAISLAAAYAGATPVSVQTGGGNSAVYAGDDFAAVDETLFLHTPMYTRGNASSTGTIYLQVNLGFRAGVTLSGSVDIGFFGGFSDLA